MKIDQKEVASEKNVQNELIYVLIHFIVIRYSANTGYPMNISFMFI